MRRLLALNACIWLASSAAADPLDDFSAWVERAEEVRNADRDPLMAACTPDTARRLSFEEFAIYSPDYMWECVTVSGLTQGRFVYGAPEHLYASDRWEVQFGNQGNEDDDYQWDRSNPFRFGIDTNDLPHPEFGSWLYEVTVTGIAKDCEAFSDSLSRRNEVANFASRGDGLVISMPSRYCHTFRGGVIDPVAISYGERRRFPRLIGDEARQRFGSLQPLDSRWPIREEIVDAGNAFLSALRAGDRAQLTELAGGHLEESWSEAYVSPTSPYRQLETRPGAPQFIVFEPDGQPRNSAPSEFALQSFSAYICFCVEDDCDGRWPISVGDTQSAADRPYVCAYRAQEIQADETLWTTIRPAPWYDFGTGSPFHEPDSAAPN